MKSTPWSLLVVLWLFSLCNAHIIDYSDVELFSRESLLLSEQQFIFSSEGSFMVEMTNVTMKAHLSSGMVLDY
jgi:hypothetical protein